MSNIIRESLSIKNARAATWLNALDADTNPGKLLCYTAPIPAAGAAITTQTLLGTLTLSKPSGTVSNGVFTFASITGDQSADAAGTIAFVRAVDGANNFCFDMDATVDGGGGAVQFNALSTVVGVGIAATTGTITEQ